MRRSRKFYLRDHTNSEVWEFHIWFSGTKSKSFPTPPPLNLPNIHKHKHYTLQNWKTRSWSRRETDWSTRGRIKTRESAEPEDEEPHPAVLGILYRSICNAFFFFNKKKRKKTFWVHCSFFFGMFFLPTFFILPISPSCSMELSQREHSVTTTRGTFCDDYKGNILWQLQNKKKTNRNSSQARAANVQPKNKKNRKKIPSFPLRHKNKIHVYNACKIHFSWH